MDNGQMLEFLKRFKGGEVYARLEELRESRITSYNSILSAPISSLPDLSNHCRIGGVVEGLKIDLVDELIEELEQETEEKGKE
jgi:hypothetical protein